MQDCPGKSLCYSERTAQEQWPTIYFQSLALLGKYAWAKHRSIFVQESGLTLWYEVARVDVILCDCMWDTCE